MPTERDEYDPRISPLDVPLPDSRKVRVKQRHVYPAHRPPDQKGQDDYYGYHERQSNRFDDRPESPVRDFAPPLTELPQETSMFKFLFELLISPNGDPKMQRLHKLCLSLTVFGLCLSTAAAYGLLPIFSGFARASGLNDIRVDILEQRLFDNRVRWCNAATPDGRQYYADKTTELLNKYRNTTGAAMQLPSCLELR